MAASGYKIRVKGARELARAFRRMQGDLKKQFAAEIKAVAGIIAEDAERRFSSIDARSASAIRPRVRAGYRGFAEQPLRRTTGQHPEFAVMQMNVAFLPALEAKRNEGIKRVENMLDRLGRAAGF